MKVLFLDIDGVLNSSQSSYYYRHIIKRDENAFDKDKEDVLQWLAQEFDPMAISNLYRIIDKTGCKIVISSTWRLGETLETMKSWFKGLPLIQSAIIGSTPSLRVKTPNGQIINVPRGVEIHAWLVDYKMDKYKSKKYAILDDDSDMWPVHVNFFQTKTNTGLDWETAEHVIEFLNYIEPEPAKSDT
jgi:hypothetical protein